MKRWLIIGIGWYKGFLRPKGRSVSGPPHISSASNGLRSDTQWPPLRNMHWLQLLWIEDELPRQNSPRRGEMRRHSPWCDKNEDRERHRSGQRSRRDLTTTNEHQLIREIDTIIGGPHIRGESKNAQRNYTREARPMASYIVSQSQRMRSIELITFTPEDTVGVHYPHCDALVVRAAVAQNRLKRMLVDNMSSVNILFDSAYDKMMVDMNSPLRHSFCMDSPDIGSFQDDGSPRP